MRKVGYRQINAMGILGAEETVAYASVMMW